jgi:lactate permease
MIPYPDEVRMFDQFTVVTDPVAHSVALSAIFAALPLFTLFVLLGILRMKAWLAGLLSLGVGLVVAILIYSMPAAAERPADNDGFLLFDRCHDSGRGRR